MNGMEATENHFGMEGKATAKLKKSKQCIKWETQQ